MTTKQSLYFRLYFWGNFLRLVMIPSRKMKTLLEYGDVLLHPGSENILLIFIYPLLSKVCCVKILGIGPWPSPHPWINIKTKSDNEKFDWFQLIGVPTVGCPVDYHKNGGNRCSRLRNREDLQVIATRASSSTNTDCCCYS